MSVQCDNSIDHSQFCICLEVTFSGLTTCRRELDMERQAHSQTTRKFLLGRKPRILLTDLVFSEKLYAQIINDLRPVFRA